MLHAVFSAIKQQLNAGNGNLPCEWFNAQYEATMPNERGYYIEFPDKMPFAPASKDLRRAPLTVRVHFYSKALQTHDGITDAQVSAHETDALACKTLLDGHTPPNGSCSRITFTGWQHWHRWRGWMVTFIEFETKLVL